MNYFAGALPENGQLREVTFFLTHTNRFAGALPDGGMRAMLAVSNFDIAKNSFTGMLPESRLREVEDFRIFSNRFFGALPDVGMQAMLA
eukprot:2336758-Amphidinium_carterae.1